MAHPLGSLPERVTIVEVGPRDGLQNETVTVPTEDKVRLIITLVEAGLTRVEATSFVHPRWVPQLSDAEEVMRKVPRRPGLIYSALIPNARGLDRALEVGIDEAVLFLSASETHNQKNINKSVAQALAEYAALAEKAAAAGLRVRVAISTAFGCAEEGDVSPDRVVAIAREVAGWGVDEVNLCDTTGMGNPRQVAELLEKVESLVPPSRLALHFHNTRGTALVNVVAGLLAGVTIFDSSIGGLGGCPYAPGATGNVATEDLTHMLEEMGIETGIDLTKLLAAARLAQELVKRPLEAHVLRAGPTRHSPSPSALRMGG